MTGALAESGHEVTVAVRPGSELDTITVEHAKGSFSAPVRCITTPDGAPVFDHVFVGVKAHQTEGAAGWLKALVGPATTVHILQNGIEHNERVRPLVDPGATLVPCVVSLPAQRSGHGQITVAAPGRLVVASGPGGDALAELVSSTFVEVRVTDDWAQAAWSKLMLNASLGAFGVLTGKHNGFIDAEPAARSFVLGIMQEVAEVARAEGADLGEGAPERMLTRVLAAATDHLSSITVDRIAGRPTEWDARNAVVSRYAAKHNIDVPLNDLATALIKLGD